MLLFRSEEDLVGWSDETGIERGEAFDLDRLWRLASTWYDDRLDRDWRRRSINERQALFDAAGLNGEFWALPDPP
jgi:hypothetical protein